MIARIEQDHGRFRQMVRGRIKKELRKYITHGEMIGRKGKDLVSIPIPQINIPHFVYGAKKVGGVGQGDGESGTPIGVGDEPGNMGAGDAPGEHLVEVDVTLEELAEILGEELELPRIKPKGKQNIIDEKKKYIGIRQAGPESLRHFKRTYKEALKRQVSSGIYNYEDPLVIPIREDKRYRSWQVSQSRQSSAVIFYMMDVSGSMSDEQKEIVRIESFWIDTWLRAHYRGLISRYLIHDAVAREVDQKMFYTTRESGGTMISSVYKLCHQIIDQEYNPSDWNVYGFHFSDGDNWGEDDDQCIELLSTQLLRKCNLFCYGQVESIYGGGHFFSSLEHALADADNLAMSRITSRDGIYDSIKAFLRKGK
ncbi:MAG: DUF444 family protein [Candidatus Latescibacteria bacterium]|nr:DUF444 family protein [Candidatus Latescibacterota bacterium]